MGKSGENNLIQLRGLRLHRRDDLGMIMAVNINPPRGYAVDNAPPAFGIKIRALGTVDKDRVRQQTMLGERMPDAG
jgi:hypothetical protein